MRGNKSSSSADIYSETVYRDLVRREFKRSERSGQLCQVLLVYRTNAQGLVVPLGTELAGKAISLLSMSVRETDYVGWYRQDRILGVLLTVLRSDSVVDGCDNLKTRLVDRLRVDSILTDDHSLQVHVFEQSELAAFHGFDDPASLPGSKD